MIFCKGLNACVKNRKRMRVHLVGWKMSGTCLNPIKIDKLIHTLLTNIIMLLALT